MTVDPMAAPATTGHGRVGLAIGQATGIYRDLADAVECAALEMGIDPLVITDAVTARAADVILAVGYPGYTPWLAEPIAGLRIAWLGEPLPSPGEPSHVRLRRRMPMGRALDGAITVRTLGRRREVPERLTGMRERAAYERDQRLNLRDHLRAARAGIRLVVTSIDRRDSLRRYGADALVVPFGFHPVLAGQPQPVDDDERDIDVLVLAAAATDLPTRRVRLLAEVRRALGPDVRVEVVEDGAWGVDRHRLIGRARVVLNIHRVPGNFTGIRTVLVGAAGAVLVSEPVDTPAPFVPGLHYVEAPAAELAAAIQAILADRPRRLAMAGTLQRFVVDELTMARSIATILETAR